MEIIKKIAKKAALALLFIIGLLGILYVLYLVMEFIPDRIAAIRSGQGGRVEQEEDPEDISDWLYEEPAGEVTLQVFRKAGKTYLVDSAEPVEVGEPLEDGHFYEIVANVTYLNGGVAGYYNYPQVNSVMSYEEVSPFDLDLQSITEDWYGLVFIGDYADGDFFMNEYGERAVWKDGDWVWEYDSKLEMKDGTFVYCLSGITEDDVQKGMDNGVLACEDYIVMP